MSRRIQPSGFVIEAVSLGLAALGVLALASLFQSEGFESELERDIYNDLMEYAEDDIE